MEVLLVCRNCLWQFLALVSLYNQPRIYYGAFNATFSGAISDSGVISY